MSQSIDPRREISTRPAPDEIGIYVGLSDAERNEALGEVVDRYRVYKIYTQYGDPNLIDIFIQIGVDVLTNLAASGLIVGIRNLLSRMRQKARPGNRIAVNIQAKPGEFVAHYSFSGDDADLADRALETFTQAVQEFVSSNHAARFQYDQEADVFREVGEDPYPGCGRVT
jgi:hypothetical protein